METPAQKLASIVLQRLIEEGLLRANEREKLLTKLAEGKVNAEDWRLAVELSGSKGREK